MFQISSDSLKRDVLVEALSNDKAGALVVFEGWVRDHNEGKKVKSLEYQVYHELALKEGHKILDEAKEKFNLHDVLAVHREGHLALNECAVWIGATASHRDDAFKATRFVIDEIKHRLPVWKKEHYLEHEPKWVFCRDHHHHVHFSENEFYQKQSLVTNQDKLKKSHIVVVGAGGLGCPALISLTQAGVGKITIVDFDKIHISNIHRQSLYSPKLVGEYKAVVAKNYLKDLNPFIELQAITEMVMLEHLSGDLVLDCTDNMDTKYFLHDACFKLGLPLVSASIYKNEGQIRTFKDSGCLRCFTQVTPDDSLLGNCNDFGVLGASVNILGSLQASEAINFLIDGVNSSLTQSLYLNFKNLSQIKITNTKNNDCKVCRGEVDLSVDGLEVTGGMEVLDIRSLSDEEVFKLKPNNVALCCHRGIRSKKLALALRENGYDVYSFKGGACSL